jgi:hypothetical protein
MKENETDDRLSRAVVVTQELNTGLSSISARARMSMK